MVSNQMKPFYRKLTQSDQSYTKVAKTNDSGTRSNIPRIMD